MTVNAITDTKKRENRDCAYLSSYYPTGVQLSGHYTPVTAYMMQQKTCTAPVNHWRANFQELQRQIPRAQHIKYRNL